MSDHRYTLERYSTPSSRHTCPACGKRKTFARYVDNEAPGKTYLADHVGRCNREIDCAYHCAPSQYFKDNPNNKPAQPVNYTPPPRPPRKPIVHIPAELMHQSMKNYGANNFILYLRRLFDPCVVDHLINLYHIGTSNGAKWWGKGGNGMSTVFYFLNINKQIRYGQVKLFDSTGHTAKFIDHDGDSSSCTTGVHTILKGAYKANMTALPDWLKGYYEYREQGNLLLDCFFGEHLLNMQEYSTLPVAIVEAPKTAIVASVFFPEYCWLAIGSLSYLTPDRCKVLAGKRIVLFPDLGAYGKWCDRAALCFTGNTQYKVSDLLERIATPEQRSKGLDLCDYLETEQVRRDLVNNFKQAIITGNLQTDAEHISMWYKYERRGLRAIDRKQAYEELIAEGELTITDQQGNPIQQQLNTAA